jgi:ribosomal protein S12 methylthiotransferase accessory factor
MNWIDTADDLVRNLGEAHPTVPTKIYPSTSADVDLPAGQELIRKGVIRQIRDVEIVSSPITLFGSVALIGGQYPAGRFLSPRVCGGSGFSQEQARVRAYGEAAERYSAAFYDESALRLDSYCNLQGDAVSPDSFALYSREQYAVSGFEYRPFLEATRVNWVQGYSLTQQRPVFVPAAFVYLPYWPVGAETPIGSFPSTGLACGRSFLEASLRGIFEVIERDAIMVMWLNRVAAQRIDLGTLADARLQSLAGSSENGNIKIFDITTDVRIPTRFALLTDSYRGRSLVSCGAATNWDAESAAEKAVIEALVVRQVVQKIIKTYPPRNYGKDYQKVREIDDHLKFYTNPDMLPALDFLTRMNELPDVQPDTSMPEREFSLQLKACLGLLADRNLEAIVVDVTRPEVAETGLCVVRVIIPGMIPLTFGAGHVCAGGRRLADVPRALGYEMPDDQAWPNPMPHPFA